MSPCEVSAGAGNEEAPGKKIGGFISTRQMPRGQVLWEPGWGGRGRRPGAPLPPPPRGPPRHQSAAAGRDLPLWTYLGLQSSSRQGEDPPWGLTPGARAACPRDSPAAVIALRGRVISMLSVRKQARRG